MLETCGVAAGGMAADEAVRRADDNHVAVMTGGRDAAEVRRFSEEHFIPRWPADTTAVPVSRTVGREQVVDELVMGFTHDVEMDFMLPGVAPTGLPVTGAAQGRKMLDRSLAPNALIPGWSAGATS